MRYYRAFEANDGEAKIINETKLTEHSFFLFYGIYSSLPPRFSGLTAFSCTVSLFFCLSLSLAFYSWSAPFYTFSPSFFSSSALPLFVFASSYYPLTEILRSTWGPLSLTVACFFSQRSYFPLVAIIPSQCQHCVTLTLCWFCSL